MSRSSPLELEFSRKYDESHSLNYFHKHRETPARRLSHFREQQIARKALRRAGSPTLVLDLPCGAGRFWPLLCEQQNRVIFAADRSESMLKTAREQQAAEVVARVKSFQTSAFAIDLNDGAVDCVFCIRLLHHIEKSEHRLALLREFHRVTRDTLIVSLWVDGNYKAWRRRKLEEKRAARGESGQNRFIVPRRQIESEFEQAGFTLIEHFDFLPVYSQWRTYVLCKGDF